MGCLRCRSCAYILRINSEGLMSRSAISSNRKATNISLDMSLLEQARAFNINISRACERGLAEQIAESRAERWRAENAEALALSNRYDERNGLPLSGFRSEENTSELQSPIRNSHAV